MLMAMVLLMAVNAVAAKPSGTLPVIHITTQGNQDVTSKDHYLKGTYYMTVPTDSELEPIASAEAPATLQIKGRGNYTWTGFDKKPYRLKLDEKAPLAGMKKSKHFALLAHADDDLGFLRNTVGFTISRMLKLPFTPAQEPVELVLNGDYRGLYFLTETIRVDGNRVDVTEQEDKAPEGSDVTGGWLVEIDNYDDEFQIKLREGNGEQIRVTLKSPEELSNEQRKFVTDQFTEMNRRIYVGDKNSRDWEEMIDIDRLVRFYIVQEVLDNAESFHGSCYMHREKGEGEKWEFGPVWDFGNSYRRGVDKFIYQDAPFGNTWIGEIAKFPHFQEVVKRIWKEYLHDVDDALPDVIEDFAEKIRKAAASDADRWPSYGNRNMTERVSRFKNKLYSKVAWMKVQWGSDAVYEAEETSLSVRDDGTVHSPVSVPKAYDVAGREVAVDACGEGLYRISGAAGLYIVTDGKETIKTIIR